MIFKTGKGLGKKGLAIPELLIGVVFLFVIGLVVTQAYPLFVDLNNDLQNSNDVNPVAKNVSQLGVDNYVGSMDFAFATFLVFLWIMNLVFSYMSDSKPLLLFFLYLVLVVVVVVAGLLSNAWEDYSDDSSVLYESSFPIMNWSLDNFMLVFAVFGFSSLLVVFMRERLS